MTPIAESRADGFHDPGLQYARIRTDYNATNEGTASNPITLVTPCLYVPDDYLPPYPGGPDGVVLVDNQCLNSPTVFSQSNYFQQNGGGSSATFWVLSMNNEAWWRDDWNSGPPNQSLPRALPGAGVMGFTATIDYAAGENFWRLHKVLNHAVPNAAPGIPFLAVGAVSNRGNGGRVGTFNVSGKPHVVTFTDKLWDYNQGTGSTWVVSHFLFATAEWGGKTRMLFIHLFYDGVFNNVPWKGWSEIDENGTGLTGGMKGWNWQILESYWYPGANIAYMDAAAMSLPQVCNMNIQTFQYIGQEINYLVDLEQAFRCASNEGWFETPMPLYSAVPLTGVFWGVEIYGSNPGIWTSVHNMHMLQPPPFPCLQPPCVRSAAASLQAPPVAVLPTETDLLSHRMTVPEIRASFEDACAATKGCAEANAWSVRGAAVPERTSTGVTGTIGELIDPTRIDEASW